MLKIIIICLLSVNTYAFASSLQSLIIESLSQKNKRDEKDILKHLFTGFIDVNKINQNHYKKLASYKTYFYQGLKLANYCKNYQPIIYENIYAKKQIIRTILANIQNIILELLAKALPLYAKHFEWSKEEYNSFIDKMLNGYCSKNITLYSEKTLKYIFKKTFEQKSNYSLPSVESNILFLENLRLLDNKEDSLLREFKLTLDIFKSSCSWGNNPDNARLLYLFAKNPVIIAYVIDRISDQKFVWDQKQDEFIKKEVKGSSIACQDLICRKVLSKKARIIIPRGLGSENIREDISRLYCQDLRFLKFTSFGQEPKIKKLYNNMSVDYQALLVSQLIALKTSIPSFLVRAKKFSQLNDILRSGLDLRLTNWAREETKKFNRYLFYEDSLSMELINRKHYYNPSIKNFSVSFDVNFGELDRINYMVGKLKATFDLYIAKSFLAWYREQLYIVAPFEKEKRNKLLQVFIKKVSSKIFDIKQKFSYAPWNKGLDRLIAIELSSQFEQFAGEFYNQRDKGFLKIPINIYFSPFALKFLHIKAKSFYLPEITNKKMLNVKEQKMQKDLQK